MTAYQDRIQYSGSIDEVLIEVVRLYQLGDFTECVDIEVGFEDYNIRLTTTRGSYFVKLFAASRTAQQIERYIEVVSAALDCGVQHPDLLRTAAGDYLATVDFANVSLVVMEWLDGKTYWDMGRQPRGHEQQAIMNDITKLHKSSCRPEYIYDSWAVNNFINEYQLSKGLLTEEETRLVAPIIDEFEGIDHNALPHSLVHGDIISPNTMLISEEVYILDFSVANYLPRIQELAVLFSDLFFAPNNSDESRRLYTNILDLYQDEIPLTYNEIAALPTYVRAAHAMHVVRTRRLLAEGKDIEEGEYWNNLGMIGLRMGRYL
jgi:Ser/Thr protein kinase RdoA (MazF antagonist)